MVVLLKIKVLDITSNRVYIWSKDATTNLFHAYIITQQNGVKVTTLFPKIFMKNENLQRIV